MYLIMFLFSKIPKAGTGYIQYYSFTSVSSTRSATNCKYRCVPKNTKLIFVHMPLEFCVFTRRRIIVSDFQAYTLLISLPWICFSCKYSYLGISCSLPPLRDDRQPQHCLFSSASPEIISSLYFYIRLNRITLEGFLWRIGKKVGTHIDIIATIMCVCSETFVWVTNHTFSSSSPVSNSTQYTNSRLINVLQLRYYNTETTGQGFA